jgi:hypothetical protein
MHNKYSRLTEIHRQQPPAVVLVWRGESFLHVRRWWCSRRELSLCVRAHALVGADHVVRGVDLSCEAETCRARRRLVVGIPSGELVGDAANWAKTGRLASVGLDQGPFSSLS